MSGGVDSSMAAMLLKEQGFEVCGLTMDTSAGGLEDSPAGRAARDAKKAADFLGIEHHVVDVSAIFKHQVIDNFIAEYASGRTPNPCVKCNRMIKFGYLMHKAGELGCTSMATGHYACIENGILRRPFDRMKDQTYFLYVLYGTAIERIVFPLCSMLKKDVREKASAAGLPSHSRSESQDICFIPDNNHRGFLETVLAPKPGPIVDTGGRTIGTHCGIHRYTIGQRKGLGPLGRAMFVKEIHQETNTLVAADEPDIMSAAIRVENVICGPFDINDGGAFDVQIRYRTPPSPAHVRDYNGTRMIIEFESPVRAVAPGQAAVLYRGDTLIAGGTIAAAAG